MQQFVQRRLSIIVASVAAGAIAFGWLGIAGALPGVLTQPIATIADVLPGVDDTTPGDTTPDDTTPGDTTPGDTTPGDTTPTTVPEVSTSVPDDSTTTTLPDDADDDDGDGEDDNRSSRNCSRVAAGEDCARPVTPGYERHSDDDDDDATATTVASAERQERNRTRNRGRDDDD